MKKSVKITLISLGSLVGLVLVAIVVALWLVFTPARLTPIVERQLPQFVSCPTAVERVELTFFSSFPRLGLRIDGVSLINPVEGAPCDTLVRLDRLNAVVDVRAFLKRDELILRDIVLRNGTVCLFTDAAGRTNYDIVRSSPEPAPETEEEGGFTISRIDLDALAIENLDVLYLDRTSLMDARLKGLSGEVRATMNGDDISADLVIEPVDVAFNMGHPDSLLTAAVDGLTINLQCAMAGDLVHVESVSLAAPAVTAGYAGEKYLTDAALSLAATADADLASQKATVHNGVLTLNGLQLALDGTVQNDSLRGIDTDLHYKFTSWPLDRLLALVPASMSHYLDGITAGGLLSSEGTVKGLYGKDSMPMIDAGIVFADGNVSYPAMLPWPLTGVAADLAIHTDLSDAASKATINSLSARTPRSSLKARGTVRNLFSDPHANLTADVAADLADAKPFLPKDMALTAAGNVSGRLDADVRMSHLTAMRLDRIRLSGSLLASNLDAVYDTIAVKTPSARIDFALPNSAPASAQTSFASVSLTADKLDAGMGEGMHASLEGTRLALETSDILSDDAPSMVCDFSFAGLAARMDDMSVTAVRPSGTVSMQSGKEGDAQRFKVAYSGGALEGNMGDMTAALAGLELDASVVYDPAQENLWQQFSPTGSLSATGTVLGVPSLNYPVEVPELAMDITPEKFHIGRAHVKLDESDFSLDGTIDNIDAYFRGDDILRADLNFSSPVTNVSQLLALTSGLGDDAQKAEKAEKAATEAASDEFTGPYMVPKGIDITLHADVDEVLWEGSSLFSNIRGEIWIKDGVMNIAPDLTFDSPVTHGSIYFTYRTPDRNNLFAGVSLHLDDIDMQEIITLTPDIETLLPMLRSFSGKGSFHAAAEGYMDSTYRFKMSTLRAAGSISGNDLVLRDDETFRKIAFLLKYKDEGVIRVDSLRAEFTVFRNEIDIYPFLLSVDRYKAVIGGRHNTNMNFDYNISLVQSPLPFRVAVDVTGRGDDLKFKVFSKSRYPDFYRPKYNGVLENREMELRNMIRDSLLEGRKEDE